MDFTKEDRFRNKLDQKAAAYVNQQDVYINYSIVIIAKLSQSPYFTLI